MTNSTNDDLIVYRGIQPNYGARGGILSYTEKMRHKGLKEEKLLTSRERGMLESKIKHQARIWEEKWKKKLKLEEASDLTKNAQDSINDIENLLLFSLKKRHKLDWEKIKNFEDFSEDEPIKPIKSAYKRYPEQPKKPAVKFDFFDKISKKSRDKKISQANDWHKSEFKKWEDSKKNIDIENSTMDIEYQANLKEYEDECNEWKERKENYFKEQKKYNEDIEKIKKQYYNKSPTALLEYYNFVLNKSEYPEYFPKEFKLDYIDETKILIVEYFLPSPEIMPKLKEVKYISSKDEFKESYSSDGQFNKNYDLTIYKIVLRILYEIFNADDIEAVEAISLNGWVRSINKSTGKKESSCIVSIQVNKNEFSNVDLSKVDPKACFKSLKGIGSSKLVGIVPIQPILQINKEDKRFTLSHEVVGDIDEATNIAAMDWEDFEHLVRELFEKEFTANGGEVKVTQASRDGGVDAIAFDPDPIRGGKIVIQAKRYTNTVGVSAVRDLYGTVLNEGATKGILVTTSNYGPDAYEFAKGKPITLLSGSNLLHLLAKHGHKAKIDLVEAKKILLEKENKE